MFPSFSIIFGSKNNQKQNLFPVFSALAMFGGSIPHFFWLGVRLITNLVVHPFWAIIIHYPIGSMYGIYANIGGILMGSMLPYISIYSIHGSYGVHYWLNCDVCFGETQQWKEVHSHVWKTNMGSAMAGHRVAFWRLAENYSTPHLPPRVRRQRLIPIWELEVWKGLNHRRHS